MATTPDRVLCASAMNGFDKGIETLYARAATPVTDGTAARGLALLREALPSSAVRTRRTATPSGGRSSSSTASRARTPRRSR
uniref:iron-containing alcohol dehydrogenase n=1 Tax=Halarchaeum acidiphilum TaxID=489138 RepID=UPI000AF0170A